MASFNDSFLRPALDNLKSNNDHIVESANSVTNRINAESDAIVKSAQSKLTFNSNISTGYKVFLILAGIGVFGVLLAWAASIIIYATKDTSSIQSEVSSLKKQNVRLEGKIDLFKNSVAENLETNTAKISDKISHSGEQISEFDKKIISATKTQKAESQEQPPQSGFSSFVRFNRVENSNRCFDNLSYNASCIDTVTFPNGSIFSGSWKAGLPHGEGQLKFADGSMLKGVWEKGVQTRVDNEVKPDSNVLKSVTYFESKAASSINPTFDQVVIGYKFNSGAETEWKRAYCYLSVVVNGKETIVGLSDVDSFSAKPNLKKYSKSLGIEIDDFKAAQKMCAFSYIGFN